MTKIVTRLFGGFSTVFILLASAGFCLAADEYVFRKVKWGMSPDEIKAIEKAESDSELVEDHDYIFTYKMNIYDSEAMVSYRCNLTGLDSIVVFVKIPALGANDLKSTEGAFREALNEKYGKMDYGKNVIVAPETWQIKNKCIGLFGSSSDNQVNIIYLKPTECSRLKQEPKDKYKKHYGNL